MIGKKLILCLVLMLGASAYATGFIGPPMAEIEAGRWDLGFEYSSSSEDMDTLSLSGIESDRYDESGQAYSANANLTDLETTQYAGVVSYGLSNDWQVSAKLGMAAITAQTSSTVNGSESLDFGNNFIYGVGTKFNYYKIEDTVWGISAQLNLLNGDCSRRETGTTTHDSNDYDYTESITYEIDSYDLILAIGPTLDTGGIRAYGGLYYHQFSGDYSENRYNEDDYPYWTRTDVSGDLEASSSIGLFLGVQLLFVGDTNLKGELAISSDSFGFAIGGGYTF